MPGEPGAVVLTIFDKLIDRIKQTRPVRTDGKALTTGFVYSQLVLGMPIDARDFKDPWSPLGGSTLQDAASAAGATPTPPSSGGTTAAAGGTTPPAGAPNPGPDPKFRKAMEAAFKTAQLVDQAIMVTKDDSYVEYPSTRHISFAYDNIINGMQPTPMPPIAPEVQKQIDDAQKVLYVLDSDGTITGKSPLYKTYVKNSSAYAKAKKDYADAQASALADATKADTWPQDSVFYQQQVDDAWDTFKTEGAEKVERALDIIESVGVSMQDRMIAKARKIYDAWNLGLAGVPIAIPYSYISPTDWCDPTSDNDGWTRLQVEHDEAYSHAHGHTDSHGETHFNSDSSSTSAGGSVFLGFINIAGGGSTSSSNDAWRSSWKFGSENDFHNDASSLSIDLEYALCSIERPWLLGDLFYMQNWYMVNNAQHAISDGSIDNQVKKAEPMLPMIPVQFLAIRNVKIKSSAWGDDGGRIASYYGDSANTGSSSSASGTGGVSLGFINFGASHSQSNAQRDTSDNSGSDDDSHFGSHFDGETLSINGTQIVAWLSEVVPACAPLDDPGLKDQAAKK